LEEKRLGVQPQNGIPGFILHFPLEPSLANLGLKEMGKFIWESREKGGKRREKGRARIKK
jgi:hypothetical protein